MRVSNPPPPSRPVEKHTAMPHSFGYRARTRDLFSKKFRKNGTLKTQTYLRTFKVGQIVDVVGDGAVQKGMPHKFYHGKTGVVWNVTKRAVGVVVNKKVGNRIIPKRIHVRIEHVHHSKCRLAFLQRVKDNDAKRTAAKKTGETVNLKRTPGQPRAGGHINPEKAGGVETMYALPYAGLGW